MVRQFATISEINVENAESWRNRAFVTLDTDWAPDHVLNYAIGLLQDLNICVTWFVTDNVDCSRTDLRANESELAVHPNFSYLLSGFDDSRSVADILADVRIHAPLATSIRSHCLVQSGPLLDSIKAAGFEHECNIFLPYLDAHAISPWLHWNGLIRVPHCWEDDIWVLGGCRNIEDVIASTGLVVLDFHPIHLYLNTCEWEVYLESKQVKDDPERLEKLRNKKRYGVTNALIDFVDKW